MTGFWKTLGAIIFLILLASWLFLTFFSPVLFQHISEGGFDQIIKKIFGGSNKTKKEKPSC
jgi:hypothetical protein